eukprot:1147935-Pelagomonas_calceolata.AAC.3
MGVTTPASTRRSQRGSIARLIQTLLCREKRAEEAEEDEAAWAPTEDAGAEEGSQDSDVPAGGGKKKAGCHKGKGKGKQQGGSKGGLNERALHGTSSRAAHKGDGGRRQRPDQSQLHSAGHASWADKAVDVTVRTQPIDKQPLVEVPPMHFLQEHLRPAALDSICGSEPGWKATLMPLCDPDEVGEVGEQHVALGMPKRPKWQGVVSNAQELQELEEQTFEQWQQVRSVLRMLAFQWSRRADGGAVLGPGKAFSQERCPEPVPSRNCYPPYNLSAVRVTQLYLPVRAAQLKQKGACNQTRPVSGYACPISCFPVGLACLAQHLAQEWGQVSFYEPRLDFWRQLWRALEFSDIVLHVVDARAGAGNKKLKTCQAIGACLGAFEEQEQGIRSKACQAIVDCLGAFEQQQAQELMLHSCSFLHFLCMPPGTKTYAWHPPTTDPYLATCCRYLLSAYALDGLAGTRCSTSPLHWLTMCWRSIRKKWCCASTNATSFPMQQVGVSGFQTLRDSTECLAPPHNHSDWWVRTLEGKEREASIEHFTGQRFDPHVYASMAPACRRCMFVS